MDSVVTGFLDRLVVLNIIVCFFCWFLRVFATLLLVAYIGDELLGLGIW